MNGSASNPADQPDQLLLDHYTQTRSAAAFAELVRRYGGMVYGTGLRVTGNREDASDVVQECFLALARQGRTIERSLPGWLHVMARSRAANRNRDEATRRYHERHAAELRSDELRDWDTVSGYVDEAIAALPDDMAELVVRCYLRGQSQAQLAAELHVSQPTISRRLDEALILLRRHLESLGVAVPTLVGFGDLLLRHASVPVPAALSAELGKMAAAGVWTTSAVAAGAGQSKLVIALVAAVALAIALTGGVFVMWAGGPGRMPPIGGTAMNPTTAPGRHVLNGVPRIGYDVRFCPFPGSVESIMSYLKEPVDYDYIMGVTGACFRRTYNRDDGGNVDLMYFAPEPQQRIFDALGYEFRTVSWRDKGAMIAAIRQSIDAGRPAIACGIIGPPEAGIVAGYDNNGQTLIGYSYFQDRGQFPGYYEQPDWYAQRMNKPPAPDAELGPDADAVGVMVLDARKDKPSERDVLIRSLVWAIDLERTPRRAHLPDHVCGLAAYDAWADGLEVDADYPKDNPQILETRAMVHADQCVMLAERANAAGFLRQMATVAPDAADELNAAEMAYDQVAQVEALWPWTQHDFRNDEVQQGIAEPATRRELARLVRQARDAETRAVEHLEVALAILSSPPAKAELKTPTPGDLTRGVRWQVENIPVPMAFRAVANVLGTDLGRAVQDGWSTDPAYEESAAAGGDAFDLCLVIRPDGPSSERYGTFSEHFRLDTQTERREMSIRMLRAIGHDGEVLVRGDDGRESPAFNADLLRRRIVDAIARQNRPVILFTSDTHDNVIVVTGYDDGGNVLYGWGCDGGGPSVLFEPDRRMELSDWPGRALALILVKQRANVKPHRRDREMLVQAVQFLRRTERHDVLAGPALYEAWASQFEGPNDATEQATLDHYNKLIHPVVLDLAERRHYARVVLNRMADAKTGAASDELRAAATELGAIHDLMWEICRTGGSDAPGEPLPLLGDPQVRRQIAALIREAAGHDAKAADLLESATPKLSHGSTP